MRVVPASWMVGGLLLVDVTVFLLQKSAAASAAAEATFLTGVLGRPALWASLCLAPLQLLLWTRLLSRTALGWAYAITSLAYPLTMLAASALFGERYDRHVWIGAILITAGAALIGPSSTPHDDGPEGGPA